MIIAGLIADGETEITDIEYIDRGYEQVVEKLTAVGADIRRVSDESFSYTQKAN
jgi:UDP-N-acetylglucosamine 1-carboxyvinyltransferase